MAAVTIEDCLQRVSNRFELALIASHRTEQLMNGAPALYTSKRLEKNTVIALREIAADLVDIEKIREEIKEKVNNPTLFKNSNDLISDETIKDDYSESLSENDLDDESDDLEEIDTEEDEDYKNIDESDVGEIDDDLES